MSRRQDAARPRVAVVGAGSWGTTFGKILADGGAHVTMWARRPELASEIQEGKRNSEYLPGINLPRDMHATHHLSEALDGAEQIYLSIPSQAVRQNLKAVRPLISQSDAPIVSLMKGLERRTGLRMSQVIEQELHCDPARIAVASGPNLALEIAREEPTAAVISSTSQETAEAVARRARNQYFRTFVNTDVIGTEFGGVLKNAIALAIGIVDGVGYGENTKASIITRGLVEMTDFAVAFGAQPETLQGLAGLGDLMATCQSPLSRNNTAGRLLGQGYRFDDVVKQMNQTAEGLSSIAPDPAAGTRSGRADAHRRAGQDGARRHDESARHRAASHNRRRHPPGREDDEWTSRRWRCSLAVDPASTRSVPQRRAGCSGRSTVTVTG